VGYLSLVVVDALFKTDYRFWVLGLKPLDARHAVMAIPYFVLWRPSSWSPSARWPPTWR
jgi:hypothetical protein